jgi:hypothetical protein
MVEKDSRTQVEITKSRDWRQLPALVRSRLLGQAIALRDRYFGTSSQPAAESNLPALHPEQAQAKTVPETLNPGLNLEELAARLSEEFLPPQLIAKGVGTLAVFSSNQTIEQGFRQEVITDLGQQPDGYVIGVGAATLFSLLYLVEPDTCQGIVGVDIMPEPIMTGQIVAEMLKKNATFDEFYRECTAEKMATYYDQIVERQTSPALRDRYLAINKTKLLQEFDRIMSEERAETLAITRRVRLGATAEDRFRSPFERPRIIVLAAIRDRYAELHALALQQKLGFILADFSNPSLLRALKNQLTHFETSSHVIHESNMVDHIAIREQNNQGTLNAMSEMAALDNGRSVFTGTARFDKYVLRHSRKPFTYTNDQLAVNFR